MAAKYRSEAGIWDYTPDTAKTAGEVILLGSNSDLLGVVVADIEAGQLGALDTKNIWNFPTSIEDWEQGEAAYYDSVSGEMTRDVTDVYGGRVEKQVTSALVAVEINKSSMMPEAS